MTDRWSRPYFERVLALLGGDVAKAHRWYTTPNPRFGYARPMDVLAMGLDRKIERMIVEAERAEKESR